MEASGGDAFNIGGGGSGGRIAVNYRELVGRPLIRFRTTAGQSAPFNSDWDHYWLHVAEPGTVALPDARLLSGVISDGQFRDVRLDIGSDHWATGALRVEDASLTFFRPGFALEVTNDLTLAAGQLRIGWTNMVGLAQLKVGGDLKINGGGALYLYAGANSATEQNYGLLLQVGG